MYLETMEQVFNGMDKIVIDEKGGGNGVVPYLPLDALTRGGGSTSSSTTSTPGAAQ
jgi:membrane protease subunit HflK